jgi:voltage-gated potassium channel
VAGLAVFLGAAAIAIWLAETDRTVGQLGHSFYWAGATVLGLGEGGFVGGPVGWLVGWILALFGVAIVASITGALVGFVIDFLLKEGQGMGASGYRDHIVVCGWNSTARDLLWGRMSTEPRWSSSTTRSGALRRTTSISCAVAAPWNRI